MRLFGVKDLSRFTTQAKGMAVVRRWLAGIRSPPAGRPDGTRKSSSPSSPFRFVEEAAPGQFVALVMAEVEQALEFSTVMPFGPQEEKSHQGDSDGSQGACDDPFHGSQ